MEERGGDGAWVGAVTSKFVIDDEVLREHQSYIIEKQMKKRCWSRLTTGINSVERFYWNVNSNMDYFM